MAGNTRKQKEDNYQRESTFRLKPVAHVPDGKEGKVTSFQFHVKFFLTKKESKITIKYPDLYDFKKVCSKIMMEFPQELADGTVSQADFRDMMEKHINIWSVNAYTCKEPVRYIGLQVFSCPHVSTFQFLFTEARTEGEVLRVAVGRHGVVL